MCIRDSAERIRNEADAKAREVIRQALTEKQAELEEIDRLKASREEFKACLLYTSYWSAGCRSYRSVPRAAPDAPPDP